MGWFRKLFFIAGLSIASIFPHQQAQSVIYPLFNATSLSAGYYQDPWNPNTYFNWGYSFHMTQSATVVGVGVPNGQIASYETSGGGIPISLWNTAGNLLGYTIPTNTMTPTVIGAFSYYGLDSWSFGNITLQAGQDYIIAEGIPSYLAVYTPPYTGVLFYTSPGFTSPVASYGAALYEGSGQLWAMPYLPSGVNVFNVNLLVSSALTTPEPETYLLLGSMLIVGLIIARKAKLRKSFSIVE